MFCVSISYVDEGIKLFPCQNIREAYEMFREKIPEINAMMGYILDGNTGELLAFSHYSSTRENGVGSYNYRARRLEEIFKGEGKEGATPLFLLSGSLTGGRAEFKRLGILHKI